MNNLIPFIAGIVFVIFMARKLRSHLSELLFFGGLFGLAEAYRFWGSDILGWQQMPHWMLAFVASGFVFWSIMKLLMVLGKFWSPLGIPPRFLLGGD